MWQRLNPAPTNQTTNHPATNGLVSNPSAQPSARCAHSLDVCMSSKIFLFGGWNGSRMLNDLHIFSLESQSWVRPLTTGEMPTNRAGHGSAFVSSESSIFIFGGGNGYQYLNDMFSLQTATFEWRKVYVTGTTPAARSRHTLTYTPSHKLIVIGGGDDSRVYNDVHILELGTMSWSRAEPKGAPFTARWGHTTTLVGGKYLYVFGGHDGSKMLNDLSILEIESMTWSSATLHGTVPSPRAGHTCTLINEKLFFFGGGDDSGRMFNDIYMLDPQTLVFTRPNLSAPPTGRCAHAACHWEGKLFVMGGGDSNRRFKDVHILDATPLFELQEPAKKNNRSSGKRCQPCSNPIPQPALNMKQGDPNDVVSWLNDIGMKNYVDIFLKEELDMTTVPYLTELQLEKIGVNCLGHRIKILNAINSLNSSSQDKTSKSSENVAETLRAEFANSIEHINSTMKHLTAALEHVSLNLRSMQISQGANPQPGDGILKPPSPPPPPPQRRPFQNHVSISPTHTFTSVPILRTPNKYTTLGSHEYPHGHNGFHKKNGSPP